MCKTAENSNSKIRAKNHLEATKTKQQQQHPAHTGLSGGGRRTVRWHRIVRWATPDCPVAELGLGRGTGLSGGPRRTVRWRRTIRWAAPDCPVGPAGQCLTPDYPVAGARLSGGAGLSGASAGLSGVAPKLEFKKGKIDQILSKLHEISHRVFWTYSKANPKRSTQNDLGICGNFRSREPGQYLGKNTKTQDSIARGKPEGLR